MLATAGNPVFQGTADKRFVAHRAGDGGKLWETPAHSGVVAAPIRYEIDGEQYVAILAGWGGANDRHPLAYKLGAQTTLSMSATGAVQHLEPPLAPDDAATILKGKLVYGANCARSVMAIRVYVIAEAHREFATPAPK